MTLKELGDFLERENGDEVAYLEHGDSDVWVYGLQNSKYTFHFSVQTGDDEIEKIQARNTEWIKEHVGSLEYVEPPVFVREAVDSRVEFVEDPHALCPLNYTCDNCGSEYSVDVTPKMDLVVDGYYVQRFIEEYCPECGEPMIERVTFDQPGRYQVDYFREDVPAEDQVDLKEEVEITDYTWRHARR